MIWLVIAIGVISLLVGLYVGLMRESVAVFFGTYPFCVVLASAFTSSGGNNMSLWWISSFIGIGTSIVGLIVGLIISYDGPSNYTYS